MKKIICGMEITDEAERIAREKLGKLPGDHLRAFEENEDFRTCCLCAASIFLIKGTEGITQLLKDIDVLMAGLEVAT